MGSHVVKPALVEVEWVDSVRVEQGWRSGGYYRKAARGKLAMRTRVAGYLVKSDDEAVTVALGWDPKSGCYCEAMVVPVVAVTRLHTLLRDDEFQHMPGEYVRRFKMADPD